MLTKNDFSTSDWATIRETPHLVGIAIMLAGASGLGTLKESVAAAKSVMEGQSSDMPIIRDLSNRDEVLAAQEALKSLLGTITSDSAGAKEKLQNLALDRVRTTIGLLTAKASPEEVQTFRTWLTTVAENVAKAAKEGGFLGFGGTQVSEGETAFLNSLNVALQGGETLSASVSA